MSKVRIKENESLENALRRFKRQTARDGVIQEVRKHEPASSYCDEIYVFRGFYV